MEGNIPVVVWNQLPNLKDSFTVTALVFCAFLIFRATPLSGKRDRKGNRLTAECFLLHRR